jgi:hypothetical protein
MQGNAESLWRLGMMQMNGLGMVENQPLGVENFTANAVSVAIGNNGNRLIFEIWWNFFYDLFSINCSHSPFQYNPSGHVITGYLNIIQHESLRKVISHGPKFREPQHINWKHNFKIIMDAGSLNTD